MLDSTFKMESKTHQQAQAQLRDVRALITKSVTRTAYFTFVQSNLDPKTNWRKMRPATHLATF